MALHIDCLRGSPVPERSSADRRDAYGDGDVGKAGATVERLTANRRNACGEGEVGKEVTLIERTIADRPDVSEEGNAGKVATIERAIGDRRNACGDGDAGEAVAALERFTADIRYAGGNGNAGNTCFKSERSVVDTRNGEAVDCVGYHHGAACPRIAVDPVAVFDRNSPIPQPLIVGNVAGGWCAAAALCAACRAAAVVAGHKSQSECKH